MACLDSTGLGFRSFLYPAAECGRQNNGPPQNVHVLILGTCEYVTSHCNGDFTDVLKTLSCEGILEYLGGPNVVKRVLIRGRQQGRSKADVTMEAEKERLDETALPAGFEDGGRGHKPRTAGGRAWWATVHGVERAGHNLVTKPPPPKSWKRKATRLPQNLQEERSPADPF